MSTKRKVSFRALRILTYTILAKAIIDAVMLACMLTGADGLLVVAQAIGFINIIACVMCLVGIIGLSRKFVSTFRIMVLVLIIACFTLLMIVLEIRMIINKDINTAFAVETIALVSFTAARLLIGAAFLFLMRGFGSTLKEEDEDALAAAAEKLGIIYLCCNSAGAVIRAFAVEKGGIPLIAAAAIFDFVGIAIEILMYRRAYGAAFIIWRRRAFVAADGRTITV